MSLSKNQNFHVTTTAHNYLMMPGDGTMYRFGFQFYPRQPDLSDVADIEKGHLSIWDTFIQKAYVLDSGVGDGSDYIQAWINMPSSCGFGCIMLDSLDNFGPNDQHLIGYCRGHGFKHIYIYTLVTVLLALKHLVHDPEDVETAAKAMLGAQEFDLNLNPPGKDN